MNCLDHHTPETPEEAARAVATKIKQLVSAGPGKLSFTALAAKLNRETGKKIDVGIVWNLSQANVRALKDVQTIYDVGRVIGAFGDVPVVREFSAKVVPMDPVAARMKKRRVMMGMTGSDLASLVGCTPATIYNIESGNNKRYSAETLVKISTALQTSVEWIMTGEDTNGDPDVAKLAKRLMALSPRDKEILRAVVYVMGNYEEIVAKRENKIAS